MSAKILKIDPKNPDEKLLIEAADCLRDGGLVIVPTETVYGIAVNADNKLALKRLEEVKERPKNKRFSLHIDCKERLDEFVKEIPIAAYKLIDKFWPGPLTLIFNAKDGDTLGVRLPDNLVCRRIIELADVSVVCPSANISGKPAATNFNDAIVDLKTKVDIAIDAGPTSIGVESSVVDVTVDPVKVLREGAIKEKDIMQTVAVKNILFVCTGNSCRSVMAEYLMRKKLAELKRTDISVSSAGMMMDGSLATQDTLDVLSKEGIDARAHRSRRISEDILNKSDLILAMESIHEERILQLDYKVRNRLFLLKEFARVTDGGLDIPDPIGRGTVVYNKTLELIKEAVNRVVQVI